MRFGTLKIIHMGLKTLAKKKRQTKEKNNPLAQFHVVPSQTLWRLQQWETITSIHDKDLTCDNSCRLSKSNANDSYKSLQREECLEKVLVEPVTTNKSADLRGSL